jgi:hypothetical protein
MKNSLTFVVFTITFFGMYFILSAFGLAFGQQYNECINSLDWFIMYSLFLGWWIAGIFAHDVYLDLERKERSRIPH